MNIMKKMTSPFALIAQGFVAGAILFGLAGPSEARQPPAISASLPQK